MATNETRGARSRGQTTPLNPRILALATQVADEASLLAVMMQAYTSLEKLVTHEQDILERSATRSGLGSLMRALNGEMERQVDALVHDTTALYAFVADEAGVD